MFSPPGSWASREIKLPVSLVLAASQLTLLTGRFDLRLSGPNPVPWPALPAPTRCSPLQKGHFVRSPLGGAAQFLYLVGFGAWKLDAMRAPSSLLMQGWKGDPAEERALKWSHSKWRLLTILGASSLLPHGGWTFMLQMMSGEKKENSVVGSQKTCFLGLKLSSLIE